MSGSKFVWALLLVAAALMACQAGPIATPDSVPALSVAQPANEVNTLPQTREEVPRITTDELRDLLASPRKIVVIDSRSRAEYEAAHIRGAISMPSEEVDARYRELPRGTKIVLYCA